MPFKKPSISAAMFGLLAGLLASAGADMAMAQSTPYAITAPNGVDDEDFVQIGGIKQWVTIRGDDRANPVLLIVGGTQVDGPGAILSPYVRTFQPWEKDFTVVQWDPRGAGKTFVVNGGKLGSDLTIDRLVQDGLALSEYLRSRLGKRKIILLGVNFGSTLAVRMIQAKPERFSAYVAAGQIVKPRAERERYGYERLLRLATAANDEASLADLRISGPTPFREPRDPVRIAAFQKVYVKYGAPVPANPMQEAISAPHWTPQELVAAQAAAVQNEKALGHSWGESFDYGSLGGRLAVPVFIIQGAEDTNAPPPMAKAWLDGLKAPKKAFVTIPGAGNHALETHTGAVLDFLVRHVRPIANTLSKR